MVRAIAEVVEKQTQSMKRDPVESTVGADESRGATIALLPLSGLYRLGLRARRHSTERYLQNTQYCAPASVWETSAGGTGKTPLVEWIARGLAQEGPGFVSSLVATDEQSAHSSRSIKRRRRSWQCESGGATRLSYLPKNLLGIAG